MLLPETTCFFKTGGAYAMRSPTDADGAFLLDFIRLHAAAELPEGLADEHIYERVGQRG